MIELRALERWQRKMLAVDIELNKLVEVLEVNPESALLQAIWSLQTSYSREVEASITGRSLGSAAWLDWYANENAYGAAGMEAGIPGNLRQIKTLEDLLWVMNLET